MRQWFADLVLGHIKLFSTQFLAKFLSKNFQIIISLYSFYFLQLKKIKSNSLVTVWNALGLSQQTTVSLNYSQSIKINIGPSEGGTIILSSRHPTVLYQRLTDFWIHLLFWPHMAVLFNFTIERHLKPRPSEILQ